MNKFLVASILRSLLASLLFVLGTSATFGLETTGTLDAPFDAGTFTDGQVNASIIQPDGKFLICGSFTKANGVTRRNIARFNPDGTLDAVFDPGSGTDGGISGMILQPDNKILIFGGFSTVNGVPRFASIARLESNGMLDAAFNPGNVISFDGLDDGAGNATSNGFVQAVVLQPGGKIVVFGQFYYVITGPGANVPRSCVARFNSDGTFDATYNPGTGFTSLAGPDTASVSAVVRQTIAPNDGKIVVLGDFDGYNGNPAVRMLRLDINGAYDPTFNTPAPIPAGAFALFAQADDQVIVFGNFLTFAGGPHNAMVRLSAAGVVDAGFNTAEFKDYGDPGQVAGVAQQADGKLVVAGYFHTLGGATANNVARLETNGTRDAGFATGSACGALGFNAFALAVRPSDQEILVGGWFPSYDGVNRNNIALLKTDGSLEPAFAPSSGVTDALPEIYSIVTQPDGKIIIGGLFTSFNGIPLHNIVRLNPDGTRDATFGITSGTSRSVRAMAVQTDGKIIIAGQFTAIDGVAQGRVARLNMDGTVDPTFNPGTGPDSICYAVAVDTAGNVYVGGGFLNVNGTPRAYIAKLTSTGALDTTFNPGTGFNSIVRAIAPPNGAAGPVVGGSFSTYNGVAAGRIARLDATTGTRDAAFTASFNSTVRAITLTPGGSYFVGGSFSTYNNGAAVARSRVARVFANGALDPAYVGPTIPGTVRALALQANGKIVAGGAFSSTSLKQIARFSSTGVQDPLFTTGTGAISSPPDAFSIDNSAVDALVFQADGKLLAGGVFNQYNGTPRLSLARLTDSLAFTAVSRKVHPGSGTFDITLPTAGPRGVECRTGGVTNSHQIVFTIAGPVTFTSAAVTSGAGTVSTASGSGTSTITVDLTGVTNAQTITLTLNGVNDGLNMANLSVPMGVLLGDTSGNGSVNGSDVGQTKAQSGQPVATGNFRTDVNVSGGSISASDIGQVKAQSGTSLP